MSDSHDEEVTHVAPEDDVRMTLWDHLKELRSRLVKAFASVVLCAIVAWIFRVRILNFLQKPYEAAWKAQGLPGTPEFNGLGPADIFLGYLQLSITVGIIASAPIIFYQLWAFISPGLYKREKRFIVPFVFFSSVLFLSGVAFAYYVALPFTFQYFFSLLGPLDPSGNGTIITQRSTLEYFLDFATRMLLAFGGVFELPLLISFLVMAGIVTPRQLLRFSRWAVVLSVALGAVITPGPEVTSQIAVAGALIGLYFLSLGIAYILRPSKKKEPEDSDDDAEKDRATGRRPK